MQFYFQSDFEAPSSPIAELGNMTDGFIIIDSSQNIVNLDSTPPVIEIFDDDDDADVLYIHFDESEVNIILSLI